jgi:hypothetical protein
MAGGFMPAANERDERITVQVEPWLDGCCRNVHSQSGEDGLLEAIFECIGTTNKWCFEVGAYDGQGYSNVAHLIDSGWHAVLIEQDAALYATCAELYAEREDVHCLREYVYPWMFDALLETAGMPAEPDLGSIDIDEQDFWLWAGMRRIWPRVMVVEFGLGRPVDQVPPLTGYVKEAVPQIQAGQNMIHYLGASKGYLPVAKTMTNMVFVQTELLKQREQTACKKQQN